MTLIDGDRVITAYLYDDEHEEFIEKKMSIIDFINAYTEEGVTAADVVEQTGWIPVSERLPEWPCAVCDINENLPTIPTGLFTTPDKEVIDASRLDKLLKSSPFNSL